MRLAKRLSVLTLASMLPLAACGGEEAGPEACTDPQGTDYTYVVNDVQVPTTLPEATEIALDLDGAAPDKDNALGKVLATLAGQANIDVTTAVSEALNRGDVILLVDVKTESLATAACAGVGVYLGANPNPAPCDGVDDLVCGNHLDGTGTFDIAADSPTDTTINGQIVGGKFALGPNDKPGNFTIELNLLEGNPITLNLVGARVEIQSVAETGLMSGVLGGAITQADLQTSILPTVETLVDDAVAVDCAGAAPPCCTAGSAGETIINLFDADDSCDISLDEIQNNDLIKTLLAPDVDLLDAAGALNPNVDGEAESLSLGLGFSAVPATFTPPAQ